MASYTMLSTVFRHEILIETKLETLEQTWLRMPAHKRLCAKIEVATQTNTEKTRGRQQGQTTNKQK